MILLIDWLPQLPAMNLALSSAPIIIHLSENLKLLIVIFICELRVYLLIDSKFKITYYEPWGSRHLWVLFICEFIGILIDWFAHVPARKPGELAGPPVLVTVVMCGGPPGPKRYNTKLIS